MEWYNIQKWQDNVAEDVVGGKLQVEENIINGILEVALQLAKLRETLTPSNFARPFLGPDGRLNISHIPLKGDLTLKGIPAKYINEKGEIDLSKVCGEDAREYFIKFLGIQFPVGVSRTKQR